MSLLTDIKFFPRDVLTGSTAKVGDTFTAEFFGGPRAFTVTEHYGAWFMAELAGDQ